MYNEKFKSESKNSNYNSIKKNKTLRNKLNQRVTKHILRNDKTLSEKVKNNLINRKTVYIHTLGDWILLRWQFYSN